MGKWPDFEYHVGKWLKYDRFGSNSSQPTMGFPWTLATIGDMPDNGNFGHFQAFSSMSPMVAKVQWYLKSSHFPIEIPIKYRKKLLF